MYEGALEGEKPTAVFQTMRLTTMITNFARTG